MEREREFVTGREIPSVVVTAVFCGLRLRNNNFGRNSTVKGGWLLALGMAPIWH